MRRLIPYLVFAMLAFNQNAITLAQELFSVQSLNIDTRDYDEECAVPYNDGIVFLSNRTQSALVVRVDTSGKPLADIFFAKQKENKKFAAPDLFSKELKSKEHESAVCFDKNGSVIWFTRVEDDKRTALYSATLSSTGWGNITPLPYNMGGYSFGHPNVSPDGKKLCFASNRPGGLGGRDIWVCAATRSGWGPPKNLGSEINSASDEYYPFYHQNGKLYFTSNRPGGHGGFDIYWSMEVNGRWMPPQRLDSPINSKADDYAYTSDSTDRHGYFSSTRNKSADIFSFVLDFPYFSKPSPIKKNTYNYKFTETSIGNDTSTFFYEWDFGDGVKTRGRDLVLRHTFPGTGDYLVQLNMIDSITGEVMLNQAANIVAVRDNEQPVITCPDTTGIGEKILFDALKTYLPNKKIKAYYWDFGDGTLKQGKSVDHTFFIPGKYRVILGVVTDVGEKEQPEKISVYKDIFIEEKKVKP
jgi:hypothetical protein